MSGVGNCPKCNSEEILVVHEDYCENGRIKGYTYCLCDGCKERFSEVRRIMTGELVPLKHGSKGDPELAVMMALLHQVTDEGSVEHE